VAVEISQYGGRAAGGTALGLAWRGTSGCDRCRPRDRADSLARADADNDRARLRATAQLLV